MIGHVNFTNGKISKHNKPYKDVVFKLYQTAGTGELTFNLLWRNTRRWCTLYGIIRKIIFDYYLVI